MTMESLIVQHQALYHLWVYVYMSAFLWPCVCGGTCMHVCICMWSPGIDSRKHSQLLFPFISWIRISPSNPEPTDMAHHCSQLAVGSPSTVFWARFKNGLTILPDLPDISVDTRAPSSVLPVWLEKLFTTEQYNIL